MRAKAITALIVTALVAAAFFLPESLLAWGDGQLLNNMHMESQDEEREGFAESIQLTVPEKIMLLRGGSLTVMELEQITVESAAGAMVSYGGGNGQDTPPGLKANTTEEIDRYFEEASQMWADRLASVRAEIRSLQTLGGLPEVWKSGQTPSYSGHGDLLYLDPDTHLSFQVYQIFLDWDGYSLDLLVDQQSERILSFTLQWSHGGQPNWGSRGASSFGSAWRDYWKMDSVSTGWYNEYTRNVLESVEAQLSNNGDYAAHDQITFMYDGQSLPIPLDCQGTWSWNFSISWNR